MTKQLHNILEQIVKRSCDLSCETLFSDVIECAEKALLIEVLKKTQGNQSQAARTLGISRPTLKEKIDRLHLRKAVYIQIS